MYELTISLSSSCLPPLVFHSLLSCLFPRETRWEGGTEERKTLLGSCIIGCDLAPINWKIKCGF